MTFTRVLAKGLALVLFSLAVLPTAWLCAAEEEPLRVVRLYNAGRAEQDIKAHGEVRVLLPGTHADFEFDDRELVDLALPATVIAVERLPLDDRETDELHVLHIAAAATCAPTVPVRVPLFACRFGTAEAQVEPIPGATYAWTVEGGTIVSGNGTPSVLLGFGGAFSAAARVTVTHDGCASTGAAVMNLRDPLQATISTPDANVGTPVRLTWSYNRVEPILTQILQLPNGAAPIRLAQDVRSYLFTPTTEGANTVKLTAALYRIGARRRAVRSGSGPRASSCSYVETQRELRVRPPCTHPRAIVSGGGASCDASIVRARFEGMPPFSGRWSDGVTFSTAATELERTVRASGTYSIAEFEDAVCAGTASGEAQVTVEPQTQLTSFTVTPQAVSVFGRATIGYSFVNAASCRFTAAALGNYISEQPSCSGTGSGSLTYIPENSGGNETMKLEVTGPCGTDEGTLRFLVCDYHVRVVAMGPTTFCDGGSVTLSVSGFEGHTAGPPYSDYRFYRCTGTGPSSCSYEWQYELVQRGASSTYIATKSGTYKVVVDDRLGCPAVSSDAPLVTVTTCP
jgi:hypothetical protein